MPRSSRSSRKSWNAGWASGSKQADGHFLILCRYVEANAVRAKRSSTAERWPWSGLAQRQARAGEPKLTGWPVDRPANWSRLVNQSLGEEELERVRACVWRGRPWGEEDWTRKMADRLGLQFTLRDRGRPRKTWN